MMKKYSALLGCMLYGANCAQASSVLDFENMNGNTGALLSSLSPNYGGFVWDDTFAVFSNSVYSLYGNTYGASGENAVSNAFGAVKSVTLSGGSTFDFVGADFAGWTYKNAVYDFTSTSITVAGFNGNNLVGERFFNLSATMGGYATFSADLKGITRLEFTSSGDKKWWLMDNFTYSLNAPVSAVPLPASIWLLGSAFAGLVNFTRRKTSAFL